MWSVIIRFSTSADNYSILPRHLPLFSCLQQNQNNQLLFAAATISFHSAVNFQRQQLNKAKLSLRFSLRSYMTTKLYSHNGLLSSSSSNPWHSRKPTRIHYPCNKVLHWGYSRKRCVITLALLEHSDSYSLKVRPVGHKKCYLTFQRGRRIGNIFPLASADDGVTVNGSPKSSTSREVEELKLKLNQSLLGEDSSDGLVQSIHEAARVFELAIKEQGSFSKLSWFSTAWLNVDNAWVKRLAYQASVYSLLQAASEIASRGDGRDRDINIFVQKSLLRQSALIESVMRDQVSAKQPEAYEWFCSEQVPLVVTSFVNYFEREPRFAAATNVSEKGMLVGSNNASDITLLMLALTCNAAITKLGQAKVSCPQFSSTIPDIIGRLMDMLVDFIPIRQVYQSVKDIGLRREFLVHFGPRAATCRVKNDVGSEEAVFWVDLVQGQLQRAIDRERIWSRLTTSESIEILEKDLAIFGFFIALGRSTQSFLSANGFDVLDDPLEGFVRFLIGGSVLYYPQLSSISSYQLYVEVVCEELDWLQFYPGNPGTPRESHGHKSKREGPPNSEAIPQVLDVCFHWVQSFIKYSKWLESPSNVKAARFLSRGHKKLMDCMEEQSILRNENLEKYIFEKTGSITFPPNDKELDSFDKALESVEGALVKLEKLLQDLHTSSSNSGKEHIEAACSDLEKIRKLKKEAEFLEASFRAKAYSLRQDNDDNSSPSGGDQTQYFKGKKKSANMEIDGTDRAASRSPGFWSSLMSPPIRKPNPQLTVDESENEIMEIGSNMDVEDLESNRIQRFELLRNELIELEKRVQRSADQSEYEEDDKPADSNYGAAQLVKVQKKENIIERSLDKIKETSTDVWQGTQLLAIDVAAATGLLRRVVIGDELTEKEKKVLRRTLTDCASVIPIGILMLLPVTAVGHAAMLAAIQRYVPSLIPSTYGSERLDLLRKIERMKTESSEDISNEIVEEIA